METLFLLTSNKVISDQQVEKAGGELAFSLGTSEESRAKVEKRKNEDRTIITVLGTFRSRFGAHASIWKSNRRTNRSGVADTADNARAKSMNMLVAGGDPWAVAF